MSCMKASLSLLLLLSGAIVGSQEAKPVAPQGWTMKAADNSWILSPDGLASGSSFNLVITREESTQGKLKEYLDAIWAGLGDGAKRADKVDEQALGQWQSLYSSGSVSQGEKSLVLSITVFQKGGVRFSSTTVADSIVTHEKYAPAVGPIVGKMLGLIPSVPPATTGAVTHFEAAFPPGWTVKDVGGMRMARLDDTYDNRRFRTLVLMPPVPIQGSLEQTYEQLWNREMKSGTITLRNPGIISPEQGPQPLRRRMKNGLVVVWEGGEGTVGNFDVYTQLFMVCGNSSATPVLAIFGVGTGSILDRERAPVMQFLESFTPDSPVGRSALFADRDFVGKWQLELSGAMSGWYTSSGGYLGDASTGGLENLELKSDGTYTKLLVAKSPQLAWTHNESGHWKVEDDKLLFTSSDGKAQKLRIYGKVVLHGKLNMMTGLDDDARIPTDALEAGCQTETLVRGSCLFKYISQ